MNLRIPDVTISQAELIQEPVPHCKVTGIIGREINFELLLPAQWNSRFAMGGGGGFVGSVQNIAESSVLKGYANAGTDTGHKGIGLKADWALNHMERQVNFGHLAIHRTAVTSKAIIEQYYCSPIAYSYFLGCSRGGGQAMMEA
ncbi:MAG: tannase/feruloyl esterase family alpha/beta hydrolase, partial [Bacteroidales bacterium]